MDKQEFFEAVQEEEENIRDEMTLERLKKEELGEYLSWRAQDATADEKSFWENINPEHYKKFLFSKGNPRENVEKLIWYSQKMSEILK